MKIISGGQTGADRAALDFAIDTGLKHGGFCPKDRRAEGGPIPDHYDLVETTSRNYLVRTEKNVVYADATVIFRRDGIDSPGSDRTATFCKRRGKPCLMLGDTEDVKKDARLLAEWIEKHKLRVLNVAGHREASCPGIHAYVYSVLLEAGRLTTYLRQTAR